MNPISYFNTNVDQYRSYANFLDENKEDDQKEIVRIYFELFHNDLIDDRVQNIYHTLYRILGYKKEDKDFYKIDYIDKTKEQCFYFRDDISNSFKKEILENKSELYHLLTYFYKYSEMKDLILLENKNYLYNSYTFYLFERGQDEQINFILENNLSSRIYLDIIKYDRLDLFIKYSDKISICEKEIVSNGIFGYFATYNYFSYPIKYNSIKILNYLVENNKLNLNDKYLVFEFDKYSLSLETKLFLSKNCERYYSIYLVFDKEFLIYLFEKEEKELLNKMINNIMKTDKVYFFLKFLILVYNIYNKKIIDKNKIAEMMNREEIIKYFLAKKYTSLEEEYFLKINFILNNIF